MIVNPIESGVEIVYQPAHALLSAQVAAVWREGARPARWWQTLTAVAQHDNGWFEWELAPKLNEQGVPRSFIEMPPPDAVAQWRRGIARGQHQNRWVGLLISKHASHLFSPRRGELVELDAFLDEQLEQQEQWRRELGAGREETERAYAMIRWTDWFSLVLCWRRLPEDGSPISVGEASDGIRYEMLRRSDGAVTLEPWPFGVEQFSVSVEARRLAQRTFESDEALREAIVSAPIIVRRWEFIK
ncbi:MAG: DUF3891 family protein [Ardenticatenaceae bacterium]